jgi:hypothetical protein
MNVNIGKKSKNKVKTKNLQETSDSLKDIIDNNINIIELHHHILGKLVRNRYKKEIYKEKLLHIKNEPTYALEYNEFDRKLQDINNDITVDEYILATCNILEEAYNLEKNINQYSVKDIISQRQDLKKRYLDSISYVPTSKSNMTFKLECCEPNCIQNVDGYLVCFVCGLSYGIDIENTEKSLTYEQSRDFKSNKKNNPEYKRDGHLREKINQKLVNTKNSVPDEVLNCIKEQRFKEKKYDINTITVLNIHNILKKYGYEKYYEMEYTIYYKLTGIKLLEMDDELIKEVEKKFYIIEKTFKEIPNKRRTSMFVYDYTIHKILELLGFNEFKQHFKPPKNNDKVSEYDNIWRKICGILDWEFLPTTIL